LWVFPMMWWDATSGFVLSILYAIFEKPMKRRAT
jgi:hypothetical protein